jgi:hypothetical protein
MAFRRGTPESPTNGLPLDQAAADDEAAAALPLGIEPWGGDDLPLGTASSHDLHAPNDDGTGADADLEPPDEALPGQLLPADDELNYRRLYETRFRDLPLGARELGARQAKGSELFALCMDQAPQVIAALLENPTFGLAHARCVASHHHNDRGLEILARRAALLRDSQVKRRLLQNVHTPDVVLERILGMERLPAIYRASIDRDLPERNRTRVRARLRPHFTRAEPADRATLILKTEGRCLASLAGCTFDARTTQILCNHTAFSTLFIQNLARFPATPPALIMKLLRSPMVQRQPSLRALLMRHPNAGSDARRRG